MASVARGGGPGAGARAKGKAAVLGLIEGTRRGLAADEARRGEIERACRALEALNPEREPLASAALSGKWRLVYTTSGSILGTSRPALFRPRGPIYQVLDGEKLKARNNETSPTFSSVTAGLTPMSASEVAVQFEQFKIGGIIPIKAPESAKGTLDITYLDDEMRVSRGDKGNLFVSGRMLQRREGGGTDGFFRCY